MIESLTIWLAALGAPTSILVGGGVAYVRCRVRGELLSVPKTEILAALRDPD